MNKKPYFSIIIPVYNSATALKGALSSIDRQVYKDFEVIVCDDGSEDNSKEVVDSFTSRFDISYIWQEHWGGPARSRNSGLKSAKGQFIAFLDSDDWWYPDKLNIIKEHLHEADILFHDLDIYTPNKRRFFKKVKGRNLKSPVFIDLMKNENALFTSSVVARKDIIDKMGGFAEEESLVSVEDFDLWLRISKVTERFIYVPQSLGAYMISNSNISKSSPRQIERINAVYGRHLNSLVGEDRNQAKMLVSYLLARTNQKIGRNKDALELFTVSVRSKNMRISLRSLLWIFATRARIYTGLKV